MAKLHFIKITPVGLSFKEVIKVNTVVQNKAHCKCLVDQNIWKGFREVWDVKGKKKIQGLCWDYTETWLKDQHSWTNNITLN